MARGYDLSLDFCHDWGLDRGGWRHLALLSTPPAAWGRVENAFAPLPRLLGMHAAQDRLDDAALLAAVVASRLSHCLATLGLVR